MAIAAANATKGRIASGVTNTVTTTSVNTSATGSTFVLLMQFEGSSTFSSISDNKGNTYTQIGTELTANVGAKSRLYYCQNGAGGSGHTFTATTATNVAITLHAIEITGGKTTGILNPTPPAANDDLSSPLTSSSITTLQADALLVAGLAATSSGSNPATHAESNGFTIQAGAEETDATQYWTGCLATKVVASTGTYSASFTETGATTGAVWIAAFEAAASGGGGSSGPIEGFVERDINRLPGYYEPEFKKKAWAARNFKYIPQPVAVSVSETTTASNTQSSVGTFGASLAESGAATDTQASAGVFGAAVSETGSATDTRSSTAVFGASVAETATFADTQSSAGTFGASLAESGSAADTQSSAGVFGASVAEAASAVDTQTSGGAVVAETASATDTQTSSGVFAASVSEAGAATDSASSAQTMAAAVAETGNAVDASTGSLAGSPDVTVAESAASSDAQSAVLVHVGSVAEATSSIDTQSAAQIMVSAAAEIAAAVDTIGSSQTSIASLLETANAIDISSSALNGAIVVSISETASAADSTTGEIVLFSNKGNARIGKSRITSREERVGR